MPPLFNHDGLVCSALELFWEEVTVQSPSSKTRRRVHFDEVEQVHPVANTRQLSTRDKRRLWYTDGEIAAMRRRAMGKSSVPVHQVWIVRGLWLGSAVMLLGLCATATTKTTKVTR